MSIELNFIIIAVLLLTLLISTFRILREYQRGVVFQLGRFWKVKGPGLILVIPGLQQMVRVDLRTVVLDVPTQDVISRDNVSVKVNAVIYFRVLDPQKAIEVFDLNRQLTAEALRRVPADRWSRVGHHNEHPHPMSLSDLLANYIGHLEHHLKFIAQKRAMVEGK